jgi:hypothetical protein
MRGSERGFGGWVTVEWASALETCVGDVPVDEESSAVVEVARVGVHELQPVEPRLPRRQPEHAAQATLSVPVSSRSPPPLSLLLSPSLSCSFCPCLSL